MLDASHYPEALDGLEIPNCHGSINASSANFATVTLVSLINRHPSNAAPMQRLQGWVAIPTHPPLVYGVEVFHSKQVVLDAVFWEV